MLTHSDPTADRRKSISAKTAYSREAHRKLIESRAKLNGVNAKIKNALATGRIEASENLDRARYAIEANLVAVETQLELLRKSSEQDWEKLRGDVDTAWEDLSRSVKKLVAIFSDEAK